MYKKSVLDNGVRIVACPLTDMKSAAVGIWINAGGRYESAEFKGISHYLEHMLFKGSAKFSCRRIKEAIEGVGGALNGFTSEELTCYLVKIPCKYLELALDILSDMVARPLLSQEEIDKERTVILEEIKMYKDQPQSYVHELLDELLWPDQPLGMSIAGSVASVSQINRKELASYQKQCYSPFNITVSACGNFHYPRFKKGVEKALKGMKGRSRNVFTAAREAQSGPNIRVFQKNTEQTHLALGFHSVMRDHPFKHAVALLNVVLGANMSSRLFNEVREKRGLAYEIGTQVKRFQDTGAFLVHAGIDNKKVPQAVSVILKEVAGIRRSLIGIDEFRRAKEFYIGQLMLGLEDTLEQMFWIGESTAALNKTYSLKEVVTEVERLKRQDLREAARLVFKTPRINLALIGPLAKDEKRIAGELSL